MGNGASSNEPWNHVSKQSLDPATRGIDEHLAVVRSYGRGGRPVPDDTEEDADNGSIHNGTPLESQDVSNHSKASKVYPASDRVMPLPNPVETTTLTIDTKNRSGLYVRTDSAPAESPSHRAQQDRTYQLAALRRESTTKSFY